MASRVSIACLVTAVILSAACWGDDDDEPSASPSPAGAIATLTPAPERTATPRPAVSPSPSATPTSRGEIEYNGYQLFGDFTYADAVDFPENLMLLIATGCTQCDGPTEALYRVWRNEGETHVEKVVDAAISEEDGAFISSFALRPDLSDIVVAVCVSGDCGLGGAGPASITTLYRSRDGGVTWTEERTSEPGQWLAPVGITDDGIVIVEPGRKYRYLDGGPIEPPTGAEDLFAWSHTRELLWQADDGSRLLDASGETIAVVEPGGLIGSSAIEHTGRGPRPVVSWREDGRTEPGWLITRMRDDYSLAGFSSAEYVMPVVVLSDSSVLGLLTLPGNLIGGTAGYIDVERGILTPIAGVLLDPPFGDGAHAQGRNALQAAVEGPFLRVTTNTPCVGIRAGTTSESESLTCAVDGVLVHDLESSITVGQQTWREVRLLDGREGYIPSEAVTSD